MADKITDTLPENMVQLGEYNIGIMGDYKGKPYKNSLWVENSLGEGTEIPMDKVEKLIAEEFLRCM